MNSVGVNFLLGMVFFCFVVDQTVTTVCNLRNRGSAVFNGYETYKGLGITKSIYRNAMLIGTAGYFLSIAKPITATASLFADYQSLDAVTTVLVFAVVGYSRHAAVSEFKANYREQRAQKIPLSVKVAFLDAPLREIGTSWTLLCFLMFVALLDMLVWALWLAAEWDIEFWGHMLSSFTF